MQYRALPIASFACVLLGLPAFGQDDPASASSEVLELSLSQAIERGIEHNLDVAIERFNPIAADLDYSAAWGAHEPVANGQFNTSSRATPTASALQAGNSQTSRFTGGDVGVGGVLPKLGWTYELSYLGQRNTSDSSIQTLSPEYKAEVAATVTLPLLRDFLWGNEWTQVKLSGIGRGVAFDEFRVRLMDTVQGIATAYWNLAAREQDYEVGKKSLETARALLEQTKAQYEVGVVSRVEVVESEAGVADREFRLITARNVYETAQDALIDLVLGQQLRPTTTLTVVTTDDPATFTEFAVDEGVVAEKAFALRPELSVIQRQVEQQKVSVKFARNQRLPSLDLVGTYGYQGLAGEPNPAPGLFGPGGARQVSVAGNFGSTSDFFFEGGDNRNWSGGAVFSIPLGNTTARSNHRKSEIQLRQIETRAIRLEQSIILEVRDAIRNLRSGIEGIHAANRRVDAANEQLRAEQIRLEHGESTPFQVLQREEDRVEAESQKIGALQVYHNSVADLERAQGTILRDRGIVVEDALPLR